MIIFTMILISCSSSNGSDITSRSGENAVRNIMDKAYASNFCKSMDEYNKIAKRINNEILFTIKCYNNEFVKNNSREYNSNKYINFS